MAGEWRASTWGDEISLEYGKALRGYDQSEGRYRVFGSNGPIGWTSEPLTDGPGVILGRKGAYRGVQYSREPFFVIDTAYFLVPKTELDMRWLYYAVKHYKLGEVDDGSPIPSTTRAAVYVLDLDVPPLVEQRAIAHILGTLDDMIELNRQLSETLEAMARATFKSWFVDFDPVRAKAEGGEAKLPQSLVDLFPDRLVDSELGEVPEGWKTGSFGDIVEVLRDQDNPLASPGAFYRHFSIPAFDDGQWPKEEFGESIRSMKSRVSPGAVLLSKLNPEIDRVWLVDVQPCDRAVCSNEFLVLRPRPPAGRAFVYCLARVPSFRQGIEGLVTGTSKSHQRAHAGSILGLRVARPIAALVEEFERVAGPWLDRTIEWRRESRILVALRDALLPKLVSGEFRVESRRIYS